VAGDTARYGTGLGLEQNSWVNGPGAPSSTGTPRRLSSRRSGGGFAAGTIRLVAHFAELSVPLAKSLGPTPGGRDFASKPVGPLAGGCAIMEGRSAKEAAPWPSLQSQISELDPVWQRITKRRRPPSR
jgi:hypothetical protein